MIDVAFQQAEKPALAEPQASTKPTVPAKPGPALRLSRDKALKESPPPPPTQQPAQIPPVTSEMIAEQARIEINPAQVTEAPAVAEAAAPAVEKVAKDNAAPAAEKMTAAAEKHRRPRKPRKRRSLPNRSRLPLWKRPGLSRPGRLHLPRNGRRQLRRRHPVRRWKAAARTRPPPSSRGVTATACA